MRRSELELSINWVRRLLPDDDQIVVVGSQSILGAFNEVLLPDDARLSMEVDVLPLHDPDERKADLIEVMLGRDSTFHERFGIYVDGVSPATSKFAPGWLARTIPFVATDPSGGRAGHDRMVCASCRPRGQQADGRTRERHGVLPRRAATTAGQPGRRCRTDRANRRHRTGVASDGASGDSGSCPADGTTFAKVNPRARVDLSPPTLDDLPTIYDTDHQ